MCVFFKYKLKSIKLFGAEMKPHELLRKRQFFKKRREDMQSPVCQECERCKNNITQRVVWKACMSNDTGKGLKYLLTSSDFRAMPVVSLLCHIPQRCKVPVCHRIFLKWLSASNSVWFGFRSYLALGWNYAHKLWISLCTDLGWFGLNNIEFDTLLVSNFKWLV